MWLLYLFFLNILGNYSVLCDFYDCNEPLFDRSEVKATSSLPDRKPSSAKLLGEQSWTASHSDSSQYLIFDLGRVMKVRSIETQGRPTQDDCVLEYTISYGSNGYDYADYKTSSGYIKVFKGNTDGNQVNRNVFEVPIIAQWIRINPIRWKNSISMRVELYGCNYVSDHFYFDGSSLIEWKLRDLPIVSTRDSVGFRMKTNAANGIILYSRGTQRDYLALQLRDNRLVLNIDLGSGLMTSLSVGSLLDDNIWHDVMFSRVYKDIVFTVDRVSVKGTIKDEYATLNLNNAFYIGGVPNKQEGMIVSQNYTGCIENLSVNGTNFNQMIKEFYNSDNRWGMETYAKHNVSYICPEQSVIPVTFLTEPSFAKLKGYEGVDYLNVSFSFRTYEDAGLLVFHKVIGGNNNNGYVKAFLEEGKVYVELLTGDNPKIKLENYDEKFNDGKWHSLVLTVNTNVLVLNIDQRPAVTNRLLKILTTSDYYIGGGVYNNIGFIGCMKLITINGNYRVPTDWKPDEEYCCKNQIVFDACQMIDRCNPNPCKHNGLCRQDSRDFFCDCSNTGYAGAMCHTPLHPLSCEAHKEVNSVQQRVDLKIDIDGSGPLDPFPVTCQFHSDGKIATEIHHRNEEPTIVDGFQEEGSYKQDIVYEASIEQIESLINRSSSCYQHIRYDCQNSKLLNSHPGEGEFRPYAWWVSRYNQKMDFWGGAMPGSRKCECGVLGQCDDMSKWCNCDAGHGEWTSDSGNLKGKEYLPVRRLHFGDTGTPVDDKRGKYTLGPLVCEGDDLFSNVITFRKSDATLNLPTFDFGYDGDIYFEFRTTKESGVLVNSKGPEDEILIELREGNSILFMYQTGNKPTHVQGKSTSGLADNNWHSVYIERNRKGARVVIDGNEKKEIKESPGPVLALYLTSYLSIGGNVGPPNKNGFTGCMRAFMLNGHLVDLVRYAKQTRYGISLGCVGKCASNPCLNNGTCIDGYEDYHCDCRWTSFKGPICADEIGVTLRDDSMIKYSFLGSWRSTIAENIRVGFTTTHPQGFLLGLFSNKSGEYMTISVSNSGSLRVVFDFGFERQEWTFPNKHFGLGQYHDIRIRRKNSGATLVMEVDNYEPFETHFNIKASADAQFNNIEYMYIGKNESMKEGFIGCVSRVEFDDIYPLKFLFQQNGPTNIRATDVMEDFCGVEPVTHPPEPIETRPPLDLDQDKVNAAYHETANAVIGGILFLLFLLSIFIAIFFGRWVARHKGDYLTQEERGCDMASDPDTAVMHSVTGHSLRKKKEWYI
ncbi:neurexin-4 isoform X3 [Planococcus citri]|uniref:neurexin-4 isoform X3 n=1 Tax=Planococcus citri TaxID=170843 RepID=UPI0031F889B4